MTKENRKEGALKETILRLINWLKIMNKSPYFGKFP
jgi:hypothetical protein